MHDAVESTQERTAHGRSAWVFEVVQDEQGIQDLADEWEDLYTRCRRATPYQAHGWVLAHRQAYGVRGRPHIVLVRRPSGRLVALAPLAVVRRCGLATLQPLAGEVSTYVDVLLDDEEPDAGQALAGALVATRGWSLVDLSGVRPEAAVWDLKAHWPLRAHLLTGPPVTEMAIKPLDQLVAALHGRARKHRRHRIRQVERLGVEVGQPQTAPSIQVGALLDLHREQWRGRPVNPEFGSTRYRRFLAGAADAMVPRGQAAVHEYRLNDRVVAVDLQLWGHDLSVGHLYGAVPWLRGELDLTTLFLRQALADAQRLGLRTLCFGRGINEQMVQNWGLTVRRDPRLVLGAPGSRGRTRVYALAVQARATGADAAKQRAGWLTPAHRKWVAARTGVAVRLRQRGTAAARRSLGAVLTGVVGNGLLAAPPTALRSLRERGVRATIRSARVKTSDFMFDARRGVHTVGRFRAEQLDLVGAGDPYGYMSLNGAAASEALHALRVPIGPGFVDIGSGRGRMLLVAIEHGFSRVVGVELSRALCKDAERNLAAYARRHPGATASVLNVEATEYPVDAADGVFYLYNPFGPGTLAAVLGAIRASVERHPREVHVLYANPVHRELLEADPYWTIVGEVPLGGTTVVMYRGGSSAGAA